MGFDATTFAAAQGAAKAYTDSAIAALPKGIVYKGAVNYQSDLPNNAQVGDCYSVLYKGSSGTEAWNAEFVWGAVGETNQWIKLGEEIDPSTFKPMKSEWCGSNLTTAQAAAAILADTSVVDGAAFTGEVEWSDLSNIGLSNGEATARVGGSKTFVLFEMSSSDTSPYYWQFNSFAGEWRGWSKVTANPPGTPSNTLSSIDIDGTSYSVGTQLPSTVNNRYLHTNALTGALEWSQINANQIFIVNYNVTTFAQIKTAYEAGKILILKTNSELIFSERYLVLQVVKNTNTGALIRVGAISTTVLSEPGSILNEYWVCEEESGWSYDYEANESIYWANYDMSTYEDDYNAYDNGSIVCMWDTEGSGEVLQLSHLDTNESLVFEKIIKDNNSLKVIQAVETSSGVWSRSDTVYPMLPTVVNDRYLHTNASTGALEWAQAGGGGSLYEHKITVGKANGNTFDIYVPKFSLTLMSDSNVPFTSISALCAKIYNTYGTDLKIPVTGECPWSGSDPRSSSTNCNDIITHIQPSNANYASLYTIKPGTRNEVDILYTVASEYGITAFNMVVDTVTQIN